MRIAAASLAPLFFGPSAGLSFRRVLRRLRTTNGNAGLTFASAHVDEQVASARGRAWAARASFSGLFLSSLPKCVPEGLGFLGLYEKL